MTTLRTRLLWKVYGGCVVLILMTAGSVGFGLSRWMERDLLRSTRKDLGTLAILARDLVNDVLASEGEGSREARLRLARLGAEIEPRLTVLRVDGTVVADTKFPNQVGKVVPTTDAEERPAVRITHQVSIGPPEAPLGHLRVSLPYHEVGARLRELRSSILLGGGVATLLAALLGYLFARRVTEPLSSMVAAAESIAEGNYARRVAVRTHDEIGLLAKAFNRMGEAICDRLEVTAHERNQLRAILAGMVEGVVAVDRELRVVHMNAVAGKLLRVSPSLSLGKRIQECTRVLDVGEHLEEVLRRNRTLEDEFVDARGGVERHIQVYGSPLHDGDEEPAGAVVVLHDVTHLRRLETVRREFVANVSHELKTPLTVIRGLVETLADDPEMPAETRTRFLTKIESQSQRLSNIVTDLLTLSRVESPVEALERAPLDVREDVHETLHHLQPAAEDKGVALVAEVQDEPLIVLGESEAVREIVANLVSNAIKYTPRGGHVWVRLRPEGSDLRLDVQDDGIGIGVEHQERIFERFYRVDKARSRELGGTGLGLSIVKHLVQSLDGRIGLRSSPGAGTTFTVHLPRLDPGAV